MGCQEVFDLILRSGKASGQAENDVFEQVIACADIDQIKVADELIGIGQLDIGKNTLNQRALSGSGGINQQDMLVLFQQVDHRFTFLLAGQEVGTGDESVVNKGCFCHNQKVLMYFIT